MFSFFCVVFWFLLLLLLLYFLCNYHIENDVMVGSFFFALIHKQFYEFVNCKSVSFGISKGLFVYVFYFICVFFVINKNYYAFFVFSLAMVVCFAPLTTEILRRVLLRSSKGEQEKNREWSMTTVLGGGKRPLFKFFFLTSFIFYNLVC